MQTIVSDALQQHDHHYRTLCTQHYAATSSDHLLRLSLAVVVKVSELVMSNWIAKTGTLTKEVNALGLIHRQPMPPIAMLQRNIQCSLWVLALYSLARPRQQLFVRSRDRLPAESTRWPFSALHAVVKTATAAESLAAAFRVHLFASLREAAYRTCRWGTPPTAVGQGGDPMMRLHSSLRSYAPCGVVSDNPCRNTKRTCRPCTFFRVSLSLPHARRTQLGRGPAIFGFDLPPSFPRQIYRATWSRAAEQPPLYRPLQISDDGMVSAQILRSTLSIRHSSLPSPQRSSPRSRIPIHVQYTYV